MKKLFFTLVLFVGAGAFAQAQNGHVTIEQDPAIGKLLDIYAKGNSDVQVYTIQVGFGSFSLAQELKAEVELEFPDWPVKIVFDSPTYRVQLGRFRNRLEFLIPLNKERMTDDGARYLLADWEWFLPLDDAAERFGKKQRIRTGVGYRRSFNWRLEALYLWTRSRNTIEDGFDTTENIINVRVKRLF